MSDYAFQIYLADGATKASTEEQVGDEKINLVWKVILRTGTWKLRPGPGGVKLKAPLRVYRDKAPKGHISMSELVKNFEIPAIEYVTVPLRHADGTEENTGYVRKLAIEDVMADDGKSVKESLLWAGFEITEPDIAGKIERKTIPSVSAGVLFGYEETEGAKKFSQVLVHVCLTSKPWITKTGGFTNKPPESVMASEREDLPFGEVELERPDLELAPEPDADPTKKPQPASGTVVWKPEEGYQFARGRVQKALEDWRRQLMASIPKVDGIYPDCPYYHVDDIMSADSGGKALVASGYGNEREAWVFNFKYVDEGVEIDAFQNWTPAKQEWVAASQDNDPTPPTPSPARPAGQARSGNPSGSLSSLAGLGLREAQAVRAERFGRTDNTPGGPRMGRIRDLLAQTGVNLSELTPEQTAAIEQEEQDESRRQAELDQFQTEKREASVAPLLSQLDAAGLGDPGLKRYARGIVLGDDGAPVLELSEDLDDGKKTAPVQMTATEIITGFIGRLPKDKEGRVALAEQAKRLPDDPKPPTKPSNDPPDPLDDDKRTPQEKADALSAEFQAEGLGSGLALSTNSGGTS